MSATIQLPAPASDSASPIVGASGRDQTSSTDQTPADAHSSGVGAAPTTGTDQSSPVAHRTDVGSGPSSAPAATKVASNPTVAASRRDADLLLYLFADQLGDVEALRIATENRLRSLFSDEDWGKGVSSDLPEAQALSSHLEAIRAAEHGITLQLKRAMRAHYLGPWCKATVGVGEKQLGRLLASIGDPADRERPSRLWAYCGLHVLHPGQSSSGAHISSVGVDPTGDPGQAWSDAHHRNAGVAPTRTRGQKANWSTEAKTRTYLIAESCIKHRHSPYRAVYDEGRTKYADALHVHPCKRCGPAGKPAEAGSPLSLGHQHARAMRLVMKRLLLDLWKQSREATA
jgi:hypothetical protein